MLITVLLDTTYGRVEVPDELIEAYAGDIVDFLAEELKPALYAALELRATRAPAER